MDVRKGDIVLVSFQYTSDAGSLKTRRRPAVIVSNDDINSSFADVFVVPLTSTKLTNKDLDRCQVFVAHNSPEGKAAGLRMDCVVRCTVIATVPQKWLMTKIGRFSDDMIQQIDECIRLSIF